MQAEIKPGQVTVVFETKFFGELIKVSRKIRNMSRKQVAESLKRGVTTATIFNWENEKTLPQPKKLQNLGEVLGISPEVMVAAWKASKQRLLDQKVEG